MAGGHDRCNAPTFHQIPNRRASGYGPSAMIGSPIWRADQVRPAIPPRSCLPQIAGECDPFVEGDEEGVVGAQRLDQAVAARRLLTFGGKGAEDAVENDEHSAIIAVEVFGAWCTRW